METGVYYHLSINALPDRLLFEDSLDKAYFICLLQDYVSPRDHMSVYKESVHRLADVDVIVFSLRNTTVDLVVYAARLESVELFGQNLLEQYIVYLNQQKSHSRTALPFDTIFSHHKLEDEKQALKLSRQLHLMHDDWRYDRYSSIGFFVDDRRGDWLQPWRLTSLFGNDPQWYLKFLQTTPVS